MNTMGGSVTDDQALVDYEKSLEAHLPVDQRSSEEALKQRAKNKILGVALIRRADRGRYGKLMTNLKDQYTLKSDVYPNNITSAHHLLENYSSKPSPKRDEGPNVHRDVPDIHQDESGPTNGGID